MTISDWIAIAGLLVTILSVAMAFHYRRRANDYANDLKERDKDDPIRKALESIRDDEPGHDFLAILQNGRLLLISRVFEVNDFASRIKYQIRVPEMDDPDFRDHERPQFEEGMGAIRHDAIAVITVSRSWADKEQVDHQ